MQSMLAIDLGKAQLVKVVIFLTVANNSYL